MSGNTVKPFHYQSRPMAKLGKPDPEVQRLGEIIDAWFKTYHFTKKEEDKYKEALKKTLKASLKTPEGKKLKEYLARPRVLPFTVMVLGSALAALLVNKGDVPSLPETELTKKLSVSVDFKGSVTKFKSVVLRFSLALGGVDQKIRPNSSRGQVGVSVAVATEIRRQVDDQAIARWLRQQADSEYNSAKPQERAQRRELRDWTKRPGAGIPSTQTLAIALAAELVNAARTNQPAELVLASDKIWSIKDKTGLYKLFEAMVSVVTMILGSALANVPRVTLTVKPSPQSKQRKHYPVLLKRPR